MSRHRAVARILPERERSVPFQLPLRMDGLRADKLIHVVEHVRADAR